MSKRTLNTIAFDKVYKSNNYGYYKPLKIVDQKRRRVEIEFLETGYIRDVRYDHVLNGEVRDPYYPTIYDVACMGQVTNNELTKHVYNAWKSMITLCYVNSYTTNIVCKRWLCFENFINDVIVSLGYIPNRKISVIINNMNEFNPNNCILVDYRNNTITDFSNIFFQQANELPIPILNKVMMCHKI